VSVLANKIAMVTGAAGGLGCAHVRALLNAGALVAMTDLNRRGLEKLAGEVDRDGRSTLVLEHDVASEAGWKSVIGQTLARFGRLDIMVNNAGISPNFTIEDTTVETWRHVMSVNLEGTFLGTKFGIEAMKRSGGGSIINISSIGAKTPSPGSFPYATSKAGICTLTKAAALHCATQSYNIRINSVLPGPVATDMVAAWRDNPATRANYDQMLAALPLKRLAKPEEVAAAVVFLASDASSYMTGADVIVDGAYSCW
jgi:NAD(P)-dependent dehydrogenase (short-subunit alcohol dehydrogenase family)